MLWNAGVCLPEREATNEAVRCHSRDGKQIQQHADDIYSLGTFVLENFDDLRHLDCKNKSISDFVHF